MPYTTIQTAFSAGELSPSLFGRTDLAKFHLGASTMRNTYVNYRGGASSREGFAYCGKCLQPGTNPNPPRNIPFQFSIDQGYALEFGDGVINRTITGAVAGAANPAGGNYIRLTVGTERLFSGATVTVTNVLGTTEANGTWPVKVIDSSHLDLIGSTFVNAYVSGGNAATAHYMRILANGAYLLEYQQTIISISKSNPGVFEVTNHGYHVNDWLFMQDAEGMTEFNGLTWIVNAVPDLNHFTVTDLFGNAVDTSAFAAYTGGGKTSRYYNIATPWPSVDLDYLKFTESADTMTLCCVNQVSGQEYPSYELERTNNDPAFPQFINGIWTLTQDEFKSPITAPTGVAVVAHSSAPLTTWYTYVVTAVDTNTKSESAASQIAQVQNNDIALFSGSNTVTWTAVPGASSYNIYKTTPSYNVPPHAGGLFGYIGTALGPAFTDSDIIPDYSKVPPIHADPFAPGQIIDVTCTPGPSYYTTANIGYTINSTTGSGFDGTFVIVGSEPVAMIINNNGEGYEPTDTMTITGGGSAVGSIDFKYWANLAQYDTVTLNGTTWTFAKPPLLDKESLCMPDAGSLGAALTQFVSNLTQSTDAQVSKCTYRLQNTATGFSVNIVDKTGGTAGNSYTIAVSLAGGGASVNGGGSTSGTLSGGATSGGATAALTFGPASGTYPGCPAYYQQRRAYANTQNNPDTYYMTQPGAYNNMDSSIPQTDSDAITGTPWSEQINGIQFMVPMPGGLVIMTGKRSWQLNGGNSAAITPADQTANPQASNGCHFHVPPIVINYDILYLQTKGSIFRDLSYNFFVNIYTGADITALSNHLFENHQFEEWAYAEEPFKIVWAVRDDGIMLSCTYLKEQDVLGWARHDTNGLFQSVCSITEPPAGANLTYVDALYAITKRYIAGEGQWAYYNERKNDRQWQYAEDCFCVDAGLAYPMTYPDAMITPLMAEGTGNISGAYIGIGGAGYTDPTATAVGYLNQGTGASFTVTVTAGAITGITVDDAGLGYLPGTQIVITDPTGKGATAFPVVTNITSFTTSDNAFTSDMVGDIMRVGGGQAEITEYVSATQVNANIIYPITAILPNNPDNIPVPQASGTWSISTPTDTVAGLNHLEGMTVTGLADGGVIPPQVVTNGQIALQNPASKIVVGLAYTPQLQTMYLDVPSSGGTVQGKQKNVYSVVVRMESSRGMSLGTNQVDSSTIQGMPIVNWPAKELKEIKQRNPSTMPAGTPIPLFTGDQQINLPAKWKRGGQVAIQQNYPLPFNILALPIDYQIGDSPG